jgi:hypothetical protein
LPERTASNRKTIVCALEGITLGKTKKNLIFFGFSEIFTTFAADFKGCLRVQAEMIPSNLIQMMLA